MKKIIYTCDVCGNEIRGIPIKLMPCAYDQTGDAIEIEPDDLGGRILKLRRCDFCESCIIKIYDLMIDMENNRDSR